MVHKEAKSDEFLDVDETFWRVCSPQHTKRTFWVRQCTYIIHTYIHTFCSMCYMKWCTTSASINLLPDCWCQVRRVYYLHIMPVCRYVYCTKYISHDTCCIRITNFVCVQRRQFIYFWGGPRLPIISRFSIRLMALHGKNEIRNHKFNIIM